MGERFSTPVQTGPGAHPASCTMGTGSFPGVKSGQGVTLTPHPFLLPWSRKSRPIPLLPLWAVRPVQSLSACTRLHFTFTLYHDARYTDCDILRHVYMLGRGVGVSQTRLCTTRNLETKYANHCSRTIRCHQHSQFYRKHSRQSVFQINTGCSTAVILDIRTSNNLA